MRTKTLVIAAAALAVGLATSMAQNVYSVNVVGYVNLPAGAYDIICNPLQKTNNDVSFLFSSPSDYLTVYKRNSSGTGYDSSTYDPDIPGWSQALDVPPGEGVWITSPTPYTNAFVGDVLQGSLSNYVAAGYSLKGSMVPQQVGVVSGMSYPVGDYDTFYFWNGVGYDESTYDPDIPGWSNGEPTPKVGQGFWIFNNSAGKGWVRNFTVL